MDPVHRGLWPPLLAFCRKLLGDDAAAEDAAQRALITLFEDAPRFDPGGDVLAWATSLAAWECRSERRRRQRRREDVLEAAPPRSAGTTPEAAVERQELDAALRGLFDGLDPTDQEVIERVLAGERLGPRDRKRKQRALARMRQRWMERWEKSHG